MTIKRTHRRLGIGITWAVINLSLIYFQPTLGLSEQVIHLFLEKSTWIAGLLIAALSGTKAAIYLDSWIINCGIIRNQGGSGICKWKRKRKRRY